MKIVVDAMGGDHAPEVVIDGVLSALKEYSVEIVLIGDEARVLSLLKRHKYDTGRLVFAHAPEVIEMHESAAISVRRKRDSSIVLGLKMVKEGKAQGFFSAGNTGAVVCAATLGLGLLPGVERPGIATILPTLKGVALLIDAGANIEPKPLHLLQYAIMASIYSECILNKPNSKVGLLNVGEEETKGTDFIKESYELISQAKLNFIGNVEGKHLYAGDCDVVVCDGFVGNVVLKVSESLAEVIQKLLKKNISSSPLSILGGLLLRPSLRKFKKQMDYSEYGGAPLLGVNGAVIIGHGRSNANAIKNAIRVAKEEIENKFNEKIQEALQIK